MSYFSNRPELLHSMQFIRNRPELLCNLLENLRRNIPADCSESPYNDSGTDAFKLVYGLGPDATLLV